MSKKLEGYITVRDAMRILDFTDAGVRRYIYSGKLKSVTVGRIHFIKREDFDEFIRAREEKRAARRAAQKIG